MQVTNNNRLLNPSLSEDSVADIAISKKNSDDDGASSPTNSPQSHRKLSVISDIADQNFSSQNLLNPTTVTGASALPVVLCGILQQDIIGSNGDSKRLYVTPTASTDLLKSA
uniref:Uncharacterized protein n=1 Tax=Megaselia scalaris TaxID=36166 RepID=T1GNN1_MEGSC